MNGCTAFRRGRVNAGERPSRERESECGSGRVAPPVSRHVAWGVRTTVGGERGMSDEV
jgi:hypothetical protein